MMILQKNPITCPNSPMLERLAVPPSRVASGTALAEWAPEAEPRTSRFEPRKPWPTMVPGTGTPADPLGMWGSTVLLSCLQVKSPSLGSFHPTLLKYVKVIVHFGEWPGNSDVQQKRWIECSYKQRKKRKQ